jgi:hypothetical protein
MTNEFVVVPPVLGGIAHVPSLFKKLFNAIVPVGTNPFADVVNTGNIAATSAGDNGKGVISAFVLFPKIEFSGIVFVDFT